MIEITCCSDLEILNDTYEECIYMYVTLQLISRWQGHFYNEFHRAHKFLAQIEDHSPPLDTGKLLRVLIVNKLSILHNLTLGSPGRGQNAPHPIIFNRCFELTGSRNFFF